MNKEEVCQECSYVKSRCVCNDHPLIRYEKENLYAIQDFLKFMDFNHKREPVKISINYVHKNFRDNTGYAVLNLKGR